MAPRSVDVAEVKKVSFALKSDRVFPAATNACAILDKFERQEKLGEGRKQKKVKTDKAVQELQKQFRRLLQKHFEIDGNGIVYQRILDYAFKYTAKDIHLFSMTLSKFQYEENFAENAGFFLSAIMNGSRSRAFTLDIQMLSVEINNIGHRNKKTITVNGNAGKYAAARMEGGKFTVNGSANEYCGCSMTGGLVKVNGNAGVFVGAGMMGGKLMVNGDSAGLTGMQMKGGRIIVNGDVGSIGIGIKGGDICQFGRRLVRNGKTVHKV